MKMKIVLASRNKKKKIELQALLSQYIEGIEILSLDDVGIYGEIEEDGTTFEENALIKARVASEFSGLCAIADDSGLIVNALDGAPGVYSARYAGEPCDDRKNNEKLLKNLEGIGDRSTAFVCTIANPDVAIQPFCPLTGPGTTSGRSNPSKKENATPDGAASGSVPHATSSPSPTPSPSVSARCGFVPCWNSSML